MQHRGSSSCAASSRKPFLICLSSPPPAECAHPVLTIVTTLLCPNLLDLYWITINIPSYPEPYACCLPYLRSSAKMLYNCSHLLILFFTYFWVFVHRCVCSPNATAQVWRSDSLQVSACLSPRLPGIPLRSSGLAASSCTY